MCYHGAQAGRWQERAKAELANSSKPSPLVHYLPSDDHRFHHHRHRRLLPHGHGGRADDAPALDRAPLLRPCLLAGPPSSSLPRWKRRFFLLERKGHQIANQLWWTRKEYSSGMIMELWDNVNSKLRPNILWDFDSLLEKTASITTKPYLFEILIGGVYTTTTSVLTVFKTIQLMAYRI